MKNILKTIVISIMLVSFVSNAQDITNTLAPNGNFKIKYGSTDYFILNWSTGCITLVSPLGGHIRGSIFKGADRFLHTYYVSGTDGYNTFLGINAGNFSMYGTSYNEASYNTAVGYMSLYSLTTGHGNSAFGLYSLSSNSTGYYNCAYGVSSLGSNNSGNRNSAFGHRSLSSNTTGVLNSAFGVGSLMDNTTGNFNSTFGSYSLQFNTSGSQNSAFGHSSLHSNTIGNNNSAFGDGSLSSNITGASNSAFGGASLALNNSGNNNSAFGYSSLSQNTTGNFNSAFGTRSLLKNSTGYQNVGIGTESLNNNTTGNKNTAVGHRSLYTNTTGFQNTAVGDSALYGNRWGNYNTAIGYNAGSIVLDGANLTLIGTDANPSWSNAIDQITLGNQFVSSLRCNVQTITSLSDARDKKNIQDLSLGLDFITKLKPRQFNWDRREWYEEGMSDGSKMKEEPTAGFIAQEFDEIQKSENAEWLNLVLKDNPDKWEATYGNLLPVMVKAIQELSIKNEKLEIKNANLEERLEKYEEMQIVLVKKIEELESGDQTSRVQIVNAENSNQ
jgi:hypothetical protein